MRFVPQRILYTDPVEKISVLDIQRMKKGFFYSLFRPRVLRPF